MKRLSNFSGKRFLFAASTLLVASIWTPTFAQQNLTYRGSVVTDWTSRHVLFSDSGTLTDAMNGSRDRWERIVNDPRYQWQQIRRHVPAAQLATDSAVRYSDPMRGRQSPPPPPNPKETENGPIHRDWAVKIASPDSGAGVEPWTFPAKFSFDPAAQPSCTSDYVVYPVDANGSSTQANIVGVNNLYSGTCTGTVPSALFAYEVGTGQVFNSPVLSVDGTKIAFVESIPGGSKFHVLTIGTDGNSGCAANSNHCNGAAYNTPAVPGVNNNANDVAITMSGGVSDSFSSPFVDYEHEVAYVGDDNGYLHKFTGVFSGSPTEVTTNGWPLSVAPTGTMLTSPTYDSVSQDVFVAQQGTSSGTLYCVNAASATAAFCSTPSITVGSNILDGPIVDSTWEQVFVTGDDPTDTNTVLVQTPVDFSSSRTVTYGVAGTNHWDGAFDNAYFTSVDTGHMYACGNLTSAPTPVLFRVGFNSSGIMNTSADSGSFQLVETGESGTAVSCTPLTEFYNAGTTTDYLFLAVENGGFATGTPNCGGNACVMSFSLPASAPFTFPTGPVATFTEDEGGNPFSAIIVDNYSTEPGTSQIYFGDSNQNAGVQLSQSEAGKSLTLVQAEAGTGFAGEAAFTSNTTAGDYIIACIDFVSASVSGLTISSVSDTQSNTFSLDSSTLKSAATTDYPTIGVECAHTTTTTTAAADTVTVTLSGEGASTVQMWEVNPSSGTMTLDQANTGTGSGTSPSAGSITPSQTNTFGVAVVAQDDGEGTGSNFTAGSGWTLLGNAGGGDYDSADEYQTLTSASSVTGNFTGINSATTYVAAVANYRSN
jgi:hypothetical protein